MWWPRRRLPAGAAPVADEPIAQRLASATVEKGESAAKKCAACHTFGKGEPNRVGPNLYGVVGRPKGTEGGFAYSPAIKGKGGNWTVEDLDTFLAAPAEYAPGTKMSFAGIPRGSERADLITYLNSKSDNPQPLPKAADAGGARRRRKRPRVRRSSGTVRARPCVVRRFARRRRSTDYASVRRSAVDGAGNLP